MKAIEITNEAWTLGKMSDTSDDEYQKEYGRVLAKATKVSDIRQNLQLYKHYSQYLLVKNNHIVLGNISLSPVNIAGHDYLGVNGIFISPPYRKSSAAYWLLYAVKESLSQPVIADGQELINAILKHKVFNVSAINTEIGKVPELTGPLNSARKAYLFSNSNLGFGKQMFESGLPFTWYPIFEEIE